MDDNDDGEVSVAGLRRLLAEANVQGRSAAKTRAAMFRMCVDHGLLQRRNCCELPMDILVTMIQHVVSLGMRDMGSGVLRKASELCRTLQSLALTCRDMNALLPADAACWHAILETFAQQCNNNGREAYTAMELVRSGALTPKRALQLVTMTGCELCGRSRIRKVSWPFARRCCRRCLEMHTISDYRLVTDFKLPRERFESLPHTSALMYHPRVGTYSLRFFWADHMLPLIRAHHGIPDSAGWEETARLVTAAEAKRLERAARIERERLERNGMTLFEAVTSRSSSSRGSFASARATWRGSAAFRRACDRGTWDARDVEAIVTEAMDRDRRRRVLLWTRSLVDPDANDVDKRRVMEACQRRHIMEHAAENKASFREHVWPQILEIAERVAREEAQQADNLRKRVEEEAGREAKHHQKQSRNGGVAERNLMEEAIRLASNDVADTACPVCSKKRRLFKSIGLAHHCRDLHGL